MNWAIEPVSSVTAATGALGGVDSAMPSAIPDDFSKLLAGQIGELNSSVMNAEAAMTDLAAGKPVELHEVMISLERARITVQTFVQVRNKLVESYQDLMRMQL